jgi:hypothetical protein
LEEARKSQFEK